MENSSETQETKDIKESLSKILPDEDSSQEKHNKEDFSPNDVTNGDDMPDLIWPEKNMKSENKQSELTSSVSQDTGFGSADATPEDGSKRLEEDIDLDLAQQISSEDSKDESKKEEEGDGCLDILGNGLLKKKVLIPGKGVDTRPQNGEIATIMVQGKLDDGKEVDSGEITFTLNDGDVIVALDLAVSLMELNEKCELFTSARYAYGDLGREPDIPGDANITYTLELLKTESAPELSSLSYEQRLRKGESKRERGNYLYGRSDYSGAINSYTKAVKILDDTDLNARLDEASRSLLVESWVKCYNNMAACQLKIDAHDAAIRSCEKVLSSQENNVKALFRLGKAYGAKNEVDLALKYLRRAIKLDPESKMLHQEVLHLTRRKSKETDSERELYQRMLGVAPGANGPDGPAKSKKSSNSLMKWTLMAGSVAAVLVSVGLTWYRTS